MLRIFGTTALLALVAAPSAFAQAVSGPTEVGPVVVTATKTPKPKIEVASSVTVITAQDIATKQEQTLPDVLKDSPGLNVVQTGGPGGQTSVFMRGANSNHVKVLVDGIDVSDPSSPNASFDFGQFLTGDIDRVEVLRGPQSGLYGSDAIGGVISVTTKSGNGPAQFTGGLEGGSFDTFNQNAGVSGSTGPFHYALNIDHFHSGATPVTPTDLLAPGEKRIDDYYDNFTTSTKLGWDVTNNFDLGFVGRYSDTHLKFTGENYAYAPPYIDYPDAAQSTSDTVEYYTRATAHLTLWDGKVEQTLGYAYTSDVSSDLSPDDGPSAYSGDRQKVDWQGDIKVGAGELLVLGAEHQRDEMREPISANTSIDSVYAELESNLFKNFNDTVAVRYDNNSRFGNKTTVRFAPTYLVEQTGTKLEASVGTGFKAPTLSEMFENFAPFFYGNPNLRPESSTGYDVGFEQFLAMSRVQFGATYYYNDIRNLIDSNALGNSYANVGRAHTDGVEAFIAYKPIESVSLRFDYTYTDAEDDILHQELLLRPRNKWNFDARWQATDKLSLDANLVSISSFIDGNRDFSIPRLTAPGSTIIDVAADYAVTKQFTVYGRVTNLTNAHYQDPVGFLRPGIGAFVGVKAKL